MSEQDRAELYEHVYRKDRHFSFGENWLRYLRTITPAKIEEAKKSLVDGFPGMSLAGRTFLDVGSGSGLFSLAAVLLGARVVSLDADLDSIRSTQEVKKKYAPPGSNWDIQSGSILDVNIANSLGKFDVVYSWGVLHHTGAMWSAITRAGQLVNRGGHFYLAIYNRSRSMLEGTSNFWLVIKRGYNQAPWVIKRGMYFLYLGYLWVGLLASGRNPVRYIHHYSTMRGMDYYSDVRDWLGGYPYEFASVDEIIQGVTRLGFTTMNTKAVRSIGCNEFHFVKNNTAVPPA